MFENIIKFFKNVGKKEEKKESQESSKDAAKERLHLVLMQDRANVSADFLELMKQEIIDVIKKYIEVDETEIDVRLTNKENEDGTNGAPSLYANIPILNIKNEARKVNKKDIEDKIEDKKQTNKDEKEDHEEPKEEAVEVKEEVKETEHIEEEQKEDKKETIKNEENIKKETEKKEDKKKKLNQKNKKEKEMI